MHRGRAGSSRSRSRSRRQPPPPPLRMPPPRSPSALRGSTPLHVGFVEVGELFGEVGVLKMAVRSASVVALQPCEVFVVTRYA